MAATQAGVILGTAAYMSPSRRGGGPSTSAADIYSFGVVLYEMVTGKRLFQGRGPDRDAGLGGEGAAEPECGSSESAAAA